MSSPTPDLAVPLRNALINAVAIQALVASYQGSYAVFTRRPTPDNVYPQIVVSGEITFGNEDGNNYFAPMMTRDVTAWGLNDVATNFRNVEVLGRAIRDLFQRQRSSIVVPSWNVTDIQCRGPVRAPSDDDKLVGRLVSVTVRLSAAR